MPRLFLRNISLCIIVFALAAKYGRADDPLPTVEKVRELLSPSDRLKLVGDDGKPLCEDPLLKFGDRLFPAYETIISDPKSDRAIVTNALCAVSAVKADRKRFLNPAVDLLSDSDAGVRVSALELLSEIGSERDTAPIVALLSDNDSSVRRKAARTLAKIGGKRDLVAMDIWLRVSAKRSDEWHVQIVQECRDELEKRLKKNPSPKEEKN